MTDEQLNKLAMMVQAGDESVWTLLAQFTGMIHRLSDKHRNSLHQEQFEHECFRGIEGAVRTFDPQRGSFRTLATRNILRELARQRGRHAAKIRGCEEVPLYYRDEDGEIIDAIIIDEQTNVEDTVITKVYVNEKIARLATGDPRNLTILNAWSCGIYGGSELAARITDLFGGKSETHRKKIQRFRIECQTALAGAV